MTLIQIKAQLAINEKLLIQAVIAQNTKRMTELMLQRSLLKDELINYYENERMLK